MKIPLLQVKPLSAELQPSVETVHNDLQLEPTEKAQGSYFLFDDQGLSFIDEELGKLHLDFVNSSDYARVAHRGKSELIAKAVGLPKGPQKIFDATLGLAQDAWFLTRLGAEVEGCERSPVVYLLLMDALLRSGETRLKIHYGNSIERIQSLSDFTVIYIDPMFPEKKKSALPRKEMRIFRKWVGEDTDAQILLNTALHSSAQRVVVKRPLKSPPLADLSAIHSFEGQTVRYDLYTPQGVKGTSWKS